MAIALSGSEQFEIVQNGTSVRTTLGAIPLLAASVGQTASIALFTNISAYSLAASTTIVVSSGWSVLGIGVGTYVADALANAALAASSPRFCAADASGRFWRLAAQQGAIAISQGGALGGTVNDQVAVQAAINYAAAISCINLLFDFPIVSIWCSTRTSSAVPASNAYSFAADGHNMVVSATLHMDGLPGKTLVHCYGPTGGTKDTDYQNVGGFIWRGSSIFINGGTQASPAANNIDFLSARNLWVHGSASFTGVRTTATIASPDGVDLSHKGICCNNLSINRVFLQDFELSHTKGEVYYMAPSITGTPTPNIPQFMRRVSFHDSNQSCLNPSVGGLDIEDSDFYNAWAAAEILGGVGGRVVNSRFRNFVQFGASGGPANGLLYNFQYPTRVTTQEPPWLDFVDCEWVNGTLTTGAGNLLVTNYTRIIRGRATDCFIVGDVTSNGVLTSTYIDMDMTIDQQGSLTLMQVRGPSTLTTVVPGASAPNYIAPPSDVHIRLNVHRTAQAKANNLFAYGYSITGGFDQDSCSLAIGEADGLANIVVAGTTFSALPLMTIDGPTSSQTFGSGRPWGYSPLTITAGPYAASITNPRHSLFFPGAATTIAVTIAAPFTAPYNFANGQRCRIWWDMNSTVGTVFAFSRNAAGLRLNSDCALSVYGDSIELEYNTSTGRWHETWRSIRAA